MRACCARLPPSPAGKKKGMKRLIASLALCSIAAVSLPAAPALADGRASTRNIILGIGAASYLIIQHNRKVHEKYAEDARRQAALQSENNDAWAAYSSEKSAYTNSLAEISDLKREVAYQHNIITQQRRQLASRGGSTHTAFIQRPPNAQRHTSRSNAAPSNVVSYGWGDI